MQRRRIEPRWHPPEPLALADCSRQPECDRSGKRLAWPIAYGGDNQRAECEP